MEDVINNNDITQTYILCLQETYIPKFSKDSLLAKEYKCVSTFDIHGIATLFKKKIVHRNSRNYVKNTSKQL